MKDKNNGTFKARLVAGKDHGVIEYTTPTFAPTVNGKAVKLILKLANDEDLNTEVWDVHGAFLKAHITTETINMLINKDIASQLIELQPAWQQYRRSNGDLMVRLDKALYGTTIAANLWYNHISAIIMKDGYTKHPSDKCFFYKINKHSGKKTYLVIHVDDILICYNNNKDKNQLQQTLEHAYGKLAIQQSNELTYLGFNINRNRQSKETHISMNTYTQQIIDLYNVKDTVTVPTTTGFISETDSPPTDSTEYRSLIMKLMYLAGMMRSDISMPITKKEGGERGDTSPHSTTPVALF